MLLQKAKTITTPTAYSNGFVHSVKPEVIWETIFEPDFSTTAGLAPIGGSININQSVGGRSGLFQYVYSGGATTHQAYTAGKHPDSNTYYRVSFDIYFAEGQDCNGFAYLKPDSTSDTQSNLTKGVWYSFTYTTLGGSNLSRFIPSVNGATSTDNDGSGFYLDNYIIEEDISADFNFSRGSSATRVNELGYIEDVQIIGGELVSNGDFEEVGSELVTNGGFDTDSDWSFLGTANISGGTANFPDTTNSFIIQSFIPLSVKQYRLQYKIVSTNGGTLRIAGGNSAFGVVDLPNTLGVHTVYLTSNGTKSNLQFNSGGTFIGSIDNVSVKEVGQDWTFGTGWSMGDGKAVVNGTNTFLEQESTIEQSTLYRVSFTLLDYVSGNCRIALGGYTIGDIYNADGTYTADVISNASSNTRIYFYGQNASNFSIDNISIKKITTDTDLPRINYEGFTYAESLGDNLVVNGTFDTDTNWNKGTGWSISGGNASCDGTQTNVTNISSNTGETTLAGKTYKVTYTVTRTNGTIRVNLGNWGEYRSSDGTYTDYIQDVGGGSRIVVQGNAAFVGSVDNVSVQEVIGDLPVPYSGVGSWLFEPQRSNIAFQGGSLTYSDATATTNYGLSPSGDNDSIKLESTTISKSYVRTAALSTIGNQCYSIYVKRGVGDYIQLLQSGNGNHYANYDIVNGVVTASGSATTASIESYGNWYRLIAVYDSVTLTAGDARCYLSDNPTAGYGGANSAIGNYCEFWGIQVEIGAYATSYIPTTPSTTVTRLADVCNNAGNSDLFDSEGVLYAEIAALANDGTNRAISISDGSTSNRINILFATRR